MHHGALLLTYREIPSNRANLPSTTASKNRPTNLDLVSMATSQTVLMMAFMKSTVFTSQSGLKQHTVGLAGLPRSVTQSDGRMFGTRAPRGRYAPHSRNDSNHLSPGWVCPYKEWRPLSLHVSPNDPNNLSDTVSPVIPAPPDFLHRLNPHPPSCHASIFADGAP